MNKPKYKQLYKHFFKISANYFELSDEEQNAWTLEIAQVLHGEVDEMDGDL